MIQKTKILIPTSPVEDMNIPKHMKGDYKWVMGIRRTFNLKRWLREKT